MLLCLPYYDYFISVNIITILVSNSIRYYYTLKSKDLGPGVRGLPCSQMIDKRQEERLESRHEWGVHCTAASTGSRDLPSPGQGLGGGGACKTVLMCITSTHITHILTHPHTSSHVTHPHIHTHPHTSAHITHILTHPHTSAHITHILTHPHTSHTSSHILTHHTHPHASAHITHIRTHHTRPHTSSHITHILTHHTHPHTSHTSHTSSHIAHILTHPHTSHTSSHITHNRFMCIP